MKIKKISRENFSGKVYNIGTSGEHNYFLNNVLVHNCYKSNTSKGENMSLDTFIRVFTKIPRTLTQIAFGIGDIEANPDLWHIFEYCRGHDIVPNVTINGFRMTPELYDNLVKFCGAVAVSHYDDDVCFTAVQELSNRGLKQVNIHKLLSEETYQSCLDLVNKVKTDPRLKGLNAIVFLALKPKGRGKAMKPLKDTKAYRALVDKAMDKGVGIGFDSCSAPTFLKAMKNHSKIKEFTQLAEPCESYLFSTYINVQGKMFPCSFSEDSEPGIDLLTESFNWNDSRVLAWREKLLATAKDPKSLCKGCRQCPIYEIY